MHKITLFILAAVFAVALAEGQYYVPRAYYTIDAEGHESARVPLRRLRRSVLPYGGSASAHANANNYGPGNANAEATANNYGGSGGRGNDGGWGGNGGWGNDGWGNSGGRYGAAKPLSLGETRRSYGLTQGRSVSASTSVALDANGNGYYDQYASTN